MTATLNGHRPESRDSLPKWPLDQGGGDTTPNPDVIPDLHVLSEDEVKAEKTLAANLRGLKRKARHSTEVAQLELEARQQKQMARLDKIDSGETVTLRKALRRRRQLTDPNAMLARAYRRNVFVTRVLLGVALAGILLTSSGVATSIGGENPSWYLYLVEPVFSVPLLMIVLMQSTAAEHGRMHMLSQLTVFSITRRFPVRLVHIELALLAATVAVNITPTLTADVFKVEDFLTRLGPPILIVIAVLLQRPAAELFNDVIGGSYVEGEGSHRLTEDTQFALSRIAKVHQAMQHGWIPVQENGIPSVRSIQIYLKPIAKADAQGIRDAIAQLLGKEDN